MSDYLTAHIELKKSYKNKGIAARITPKAKRTKPKKKNK